MHPASWRPGFPGLFVFCKLSLLFPEIDSLGLGLDAPEVKIFLESAGKPLKGPWDDRLFKSDSSLNIILLDLGKSKLGWL